MRVIPGVTWTFTIIGDRRPIAVMIVLICFGVVGSSRVLEAHDAGSIGRTFSVDVDGDCRHATRTMPETVTIGIRACWGRQSNGNGSGYRSSGLAMPIFVNIPPEDLPSPERKAALQDAGDHVAAFAAGQRRPRPRRGEQAAKCGGAIANRFLVGIRRSAQRRTVEVAREHLNDL